MTDVWDCVHQKWVPAKKGKCHRCLKRNVEIVQGKGKTGLCWECYGKVITAWMQKKPVEP